jgi:hypothetical protein
METGMIEWVHDRCRRWGDQYRYVYLGQSGWPPRTVMAKMIEEGILGASSSRFVQHFPECLTGEELQLNCAIKYLGESDRELIVIRYVIREKPKLTCGRLYMSHAVYYGRIDRAHQRISGALNQLSGQNRRSHLA